MKRMKQLVTICIVLILIITLFIKIPTSNADDVSGLTLYQLIEWMKYNDGDNPYVNLNATDLLNTYGDNPQRNARLPVYPSHPTMSRLDLQYSGCLSEKRLYWGPAVGAMILAIIDVDSDGKVWWQSYEGIPREITGDHNAKFNQLARYAVQQHYNGGRGSSNVSKYVIDNFQSVFKTYFASYSDEGGGAVGNGQPIPEGKTVRFMYIIFFNSNKDITLQQRLMFGLGNTPDRQDYSELYLVKKTAEVDFQTGEKQPMAGVLFRFKNVAKNKYIQVADLDENGWPKFGYTGKENIVTWFPKEEIDEKRKTILYTDVPDDATIFMTNYDKSRRDLYTPALKREIILQKN